MYGQHLNCEAVQVVSNNRDCKKQALTKWGFKIHHLGNFVCFVLLFFCCVFFCQSKSITISQSQLLWWCTRKKPQCTWVRSISLRTLYSHALLWMPWHWFVTLIEERISSWQTQHNHHLCNGWEKQVCLYSFSLTADIYQLIVDYLNANESNCFESRWLRMKNNLLRLKR